MLAVLLLKDVLQVVLQRLRKFFQYMNRATTEDVNVRILNSGSSVQEEGGSRKPGFWDPSVCVVFWRPTATN